MNHKLSSMLKRIFIPKSLNINTLIETNRPDIKDFSKTKLLLVLNFVSEVAINNEENVTPEGFVRLHSEILQSYVHDYKRYLNYLKDNNIIEVNNQYIVGTKCRGYRFTKEYDSVVVEYEIEIKNQRRRKYKGGTLKEARILFDHKYITKWIEHITIDYGAAKEYLDSQLINCGENKTKKILNSYNSGIISISRIADKEFYISIDNTSQRLHTNLTNLNSELRKFISFQFKPLISFDIKNSQLYLFLSLLKSSFYSRGKGFNINQLNIGSIRFSEIKKISERATIMLENLQNTSNILDINFFTKLVSGGQLYDYLALESQKREIKDTSNREKAKNAVFVLIFSNDKRWKLRPSRFKQLFIELFPNVYELFKIIKMDHHNSLAIILQRIESYLVIDIICKKIARIDSNIPLYTIHDSIATTDEYTGQVEKIINDTLLNYVGYLPKLRKERWESMFLFK